ncbi:hypothetical protein XU18_4840 [Perkinsela sp. CCAP 1560/4]|nr:hypothetical protein XU18_4840 [Perkinsela sp. CCAP 1560/4]|eukprot:KNH03764.1 hypothetical protein XU18_4840 [Perkinsela sp. CCAP 1560/4]
MLRVKSNRIFGAALRDMTLKSACVFAGRRDFTLSNVNPPVDPEEQNLLAQQTNRTISKSTPGKMFMLNYLSQEQSSASITNRIISVVVVLGGASWFALYGPTISSWSVLTTMLIVIFPAFFVYVHMGYWQVFPLTALVALYGLR